MNKNTIIMIIASAAVGAAASAVVVTSASKSNKGGAVHKKDGEEDTAKNKLERAKKASQEEQRGQGRGRGDGAKVAQLENRVADLRAELEDAQKSRVAVGMSPETILELLPGEYESNERLAQRKRIFLTEALVHLDKESLPAIQEFLESNEDGEPDIDADRERRVADKYGIEVAQMDQLKQMMEDMKPAIDAEREKRREGDEARRADFRTKMDDFRKTLEGLPEEERRQKMGEFWRGAREDGEQRSSREESGTATEIDGRVQVILTADQYNAVKEQRGGVQAMLGEVTGRRSGGSDWGRGRGGSSRGRGGR